MEVEELNDAEDVARRLASIVASEIADNGARQIVLAGGTSPMRAHELLGDMVSDWSGVHLWFGDERCVAPDDDESNYKQAAERLSAPGATWHRMKGELGPDDGAADYARELGDTPLQLLCLGMGPDGHTASLFPGFPQLEMGGHVLGVRDSPKPPLERITLSLPRINSATRIVLVVTGESKREALTRVLDGADRDTPASLLARDRLLILADPAAMT